MFGVEGWPSGLWRRPAKALGRETRVGSNPTPSVVTEKGSVRARELGILTRSHTARGRIPFFFHPDGWPSGLRRTPGKRVGMQMSRGFKSHSVRFAASAAGRRVESRCANRASLDVSVRRGGRTANAPVSKTGALTGFRVRIPAPPLYCAIS
jgi:hypothetical protein